MDDFQWTTRQIASLKALHQLQRDRKKVDRVKAIVLLGTDWTVSTVAEALNGHVAKFDGKSHRPGI